MEKEALKFLMPVVVSCLTNATYTCQLLNPEMKDNPEAAIQHVLLTWERIGTLMTAPQPDPFHQIFQKITLHLLGEMSKIQKREAELAALNPKTPEILAEVEALTMKAQLSSELLTMLKEAVQ